MKLVFPEENGWKWLGTNENQSQAVSDDLPIRDVDEFSNSYLIDDKLFRSYNDFNGIIDKFIIKSLTIRKQKGIA